MTTNARQSITSVHTCDSLFGLLKRFSVTAYLLRQIVLNVHPIYAFISHSRHRVEAVFFINFRSLTVCCVRCILAAAAAAAAAHHISTSTYWADVPLAD